MKKYLYIIISALVIIPSITLGLSVYTVPQGGTGRSSVPQGALLFGNGTSALGATTSPTVGYITATSGTSSFTNLNISGTCTGCAPAGFSATSTHPLMASWFVATSTTATSTFNGGLIAGGTSGLNVMTNGRVGIGTTSPTVTLDVNGTAIIRSAANPGLTIGDGLIGYLKLGDGIFSKAAGSGFTLNSGLTANSFITTAVGEGNVGMGMGGTTNNGFFITLDTFGRIGYSINGSGNSATRFGINSVTVGTTTQSATLSVGGILGTDPFDVASSSGATPSLFRVTQAGNVGIGTTSPYAKLSVVGVVAADSYNATNTVATSTFSGGFQAGGTSGLYVLTNGNMGLGVSDPYISSTNRVFKIGGLTNATLSLVGSKDWQTSSFSDGSFSIYNSTDNNTAFRILSTGQMGVGLGGSVSPLTYLQANTFDAGTGNAFTVSNNVTSAVGTNMMQDYAAYRTGTTFAVFARTGATVTATGDASSFSGDYLISTANLGSITEKFRVTAAGNVGIGTTSPYTRLSVAGVVVANSFNATNTAATSTFSGGLLVATGGGNVGIGSSTPAYKLSVSGNAFLENNLYLASTTPSGATGVIYKEGNSFIHTFGLRNTFVGENAGNLTLTGNSNTALGNTALQNVTTGKLNTAIGFNTLNQLTTTDQNTAIGYRTLFNNQGTGNSGFGTESLLNVSTGGENVGFGIYAGNTVTQGNQNTCIGYAACNVLTTGDYNVFIGPLAGPVSADINNSMAFGRSAIAGASNVAVFGGSGTTNSVSVGIGTTSPYARFSVHANTADIYKQTIFAIASSSPTATSTHFVVKADGNTGIGTSSPYAKLSVAGSAESIPFAISTTTSVAASSTLFQVGKDGSIQLGGGSPTLSCGIGACSLDQYANDQMGTITTSGVVTQIDVTFSVPKARTPKCFVSISSSGINSAVSAQSTTGFSISFSASIGSGFANYFCGQ